MKKTPSARTAPNHVMRPPVDYTGPLFIQHRGSMKWEIRGQRSRDPGDG